MINHHHKQRLQYHASTLQNRAAAATALLMTILLLCIEHVRAFANQYHITAHDAMVLASAASSLTRKLSSTYISSESMKKGFSRPEQLAKGNGVSGEGSSTKLSMAWSIPAIALPNIPSMPTSKDLPVHALGSWYSEVDPTTKPPVYDDEYEPYSFSSPTDDWPSMSNDEKGLSNAQAPVRRGPFRAIRRVAGRIVGGVARYAK